MKKLIQGILKRKNPADAVVAPQEAPAAPAAAPVDIPDELPPLAEDMAAPQPVQAESAEALPELPSLGELGEPPADLPSLDIPQESDQTVPDSLDDIPLPGEESGLPEAIKKAKEAKSTSEGVGASSATADEGIETDEGSHRDETGFFASVLDHIDKHKGFRERLLAGDLFSRMTDYWELKKDEIKVGKPVATEQRLEGDLKKELGNLRLLEKKWQMQKISIDEDLKFLRQREREIQMRIEGIKRLSNELNLFKNVEPKNYFYLHNGVVLRNLHDLVDVLEIIDEETYSHHVAKGKNDFSAWVTHVIKDKELSDKIKHAASKQEMIDALVKHTIVLAEESLDTRSQLRPNQYFWLENGAVIRSLPELVEALKKLDDDQFSKHVNEEKNDFSAWAADKLKNEDLANKLKNINSKDAMIKTLEVYL